MNRKKLPVLVLLLCLAAVLSAQSDSPPIISVLNFDASGISDAEVRVFVDYISSHIIETGKYRVIDRAQRQAILSEIEFSQADCSDEECQLEIGRMLSANQIIVGSLGRFGERFILNIKLIDVETAQSINASSEMYGSLEELLEDSKNLTARLIGMERRAQGVSEVQPVSDEAAEKTSAPDVQMETGDVWEIPIAAIKVDGRGDDWKSVSPLIQERAGDNWGARSETGTDISEIYLARDAENLFLRFVLADGDPNSRLSSSRYVEYNIDLWKPNKDSVFRLQVRFENRRWRAYFVTYDIFSKRTTDFVEGTVRIGDKSLEAKYPLPAIASRFPTDRLLTLSANIGYDDEGRWKQTDATITIRTRVMIK